MTMLWSRLPRALRSGWTVVKDGCAEEGREAEGRAGSSAFRGFAGRGDAGDGRFGDVPGDDGIVVALGSEVSGN